MRRLDFSALRFDDLLSREWLAANGNGAFSSSTLCGLNTRKYHGLLVAAMTPPVQRMVLLSRVEETVRAGGKSFDLACNEYPGTIHPQGHRFLRAFNHLPFPRWAYQGAGWTVEKQLRPLHAQNAVVLTYSLLAGNQSVDLELRPLFALRGMHDLMYQWNGKLDACDLDPRRHRIPPTSQSPEVFFAHDGAFSAQPSWYLNTIYRREQERGYAGLEDLWMPGIVRWTLAPGQSVHFVCSADPIDFAKAVADAERQYERAVPSIIPAGQDAALEALLHAAEQFIVKGRDHLPYLNTAYPWSAPSGRDAMICLPGILLATGQLEEARGLLHCFAAAMKDGLMPSELAEDGSGFQYNAADTSLWFVYAMGQYLRYRGDEAFVQRELLPAANGIIDACRTGTKLGIRTDEDGLLSVQSEDVAVTWMDAKVGDWVITPRHGRPVSINALWYNALRTVADLSARFGQAERADELLNLAHRVEDAFNRRFWNESAGCCFDVVSDQGSDGSIRPNQVFALSLPYPVLDASRHAAVLEMLRRELLTPLGLRSLASADPKYRGMYAGHAMERDSAYHQGSVFPWLLGPYVTASIRLHGRGEEPRRQAMATLAGCLDYLQEHGQLCELFDGDVPHRAGGAMASARSVAELLRCYVEDVMDIFPAGFTPPRVDLTPEAAVDGTVQAGK